MTTIEINGELFEIVHGESLDALKTSLNCGIGRLKKLGWRELDVLSGGYAGKLGDYKGGRVMCRKLEFDADVHSV